MFLDLVLIVVCILLCLQIHSLKLRIDSLEIELDERGVFDESEDEV